MQTHAAHYELNGRRYPIDGAPELCHFDDTPPSDETSVSIPTLSAAAPCTDSLVDESATVAYSAVVDPSASIGAGAFIAPGAVLRENAYVGAGAVVQCDATIGAGAYVGRGAMIGKGAIIGHHAHIARGAIVAENTVIAPYAHVRADSAHTAAALQPLKIALSVFVALTVILATALYLVATR